MASRAVASEVVTSARLNEMIEYRMTAAFQTTPSASTGAKTAIFNVGYLEVPAVDYPSIVRVSGLVRGTLEASANWLPRLGYDTAADPTSTGTSALAKTIQSAYMHNVGSDDQVMSANLSGRFELPANTTAWIRLLMGRTSGTFTLASGIGDVLSYDRIERFPAATGGGGGGGGGGAELTGPIALAYAPVGTRVTAGWSSGSAAWMYDGVAVTGRPGGRADLYWDLMGAPAATATPAWFGDLDARWDVS